MLISKLTQKSDIFLLALTWQELAPKMMIIPKHANWCVVFTTYHNCTLKATLDYFQRLIHALWQNIWYKWGIVALIENLSSKRWCKAETFWKILYVTICNKIAKSSTSRIMMQCKSWIWNFLFNPKRTTV